MQIKEIDLNSIDFDHDCGQFIAKIISNDGKLKLFKCKTTKFGYEAFNVELGNKKVIRGREMFTIIFIIDSYLKNQLMY